MKTFFFCLVLAALSLRVFASANLVGASTQRYNNNSVAAQTASAASPITMACWFRASSVASTQVLLSLANSGSSNVIVLGIRGDAGGGVYAGQYTGVYSQAVTATASTSVWNHAAAVFFSNSDRRAFLNGVKTTNTGTTGDATGMTFLYSGSAADNSAYFTGQISRCAIWNVALTDDEIASLAKGVSPLLVRPQSLLDYWPMVTGTGNAIGWKGIVLTNTNSVTHSDEMPRIYR